jgi:hypothetical protein
MNNQWTRKLPSVGGFYWRRDVSDIDDPINDPVIVEVRKYAGRLAIGNCTLDESVDTNRYEWSGPIPEPPEKKRVTQLVDVPQLEEALQQLEEYKKQWDAWPTDCKSMALRQLNHTKRRIEIAMYEQDYLWAIRHAKVENDKIRRI